ncbi:MULTISPECIES: SRPBCC domain-containing protein [unclassified Streptomyces]|uniref:SRPBCC domain-containing protein n=1 Tax=unclassified Streptomyces TaxID=2593676 RepID=UPI001F0351A7|nr:MULTISPECIES: SRPBCC domain-containing protein [unclassified Streptomyces]MCH0562230.1 SRPBCC domain-containing protein [Streptomyces sp. MUM 2J]MCH0568153.1 SRPBCC domain-containing protein [Streptomyces sp. MUM 136J]
MEYGSIERELHVEASPEVVFEVLTSPEHIRDWWSAEADLEPAAGATGSLTWTDEGSGRRQSSPFTVVEADPPRTFSFRWTYDEAETAGPGNSLLVTFELVPTGNGTTVRFRESGYRERGWEAAVLEAHYSDHRQGWDFFLPRLAAVAGRLAAAR